MEAQSADPDLWKDQDAAQQVLQRVSQLKGRIGPMRALRERHEEATLLLELGREEEDAETLAEVHEQAAALARDVESWALRALLSGKHDAANAILTIHAGAGGTESCDWAAMLQRMFLRWAEQRGFGTDIVDELPGEEAGMKSVTITVTGDFAYGYLQCERGVHRLVRISPFDAAKRRHTSFASVDVIPELDTTITIELDDKELRIDTYRASGAGGQHVNKTSSAVRITHLPTGTVAACQSERSQHQNKEVATRMLMARLAMIEEEKQAAALAAERGEQREIGFGSQIRSYVLAPYRMVKDHRTTLEVGNVDAVLDGALDPFIEAELRRKLAPNTRKLGPNTKQ